MNTSTFKYLVMVVAAIGCFGFGMYFQSGVTPAEEFPERDIASIMQARPAPPSKKNDLKTSSALKKCLAEKATTGNVELSKVLVDRRDWSIVSMDCVGDRAKDLYEAVAPFSSEQYVRYSDGRRGVARFFGRLYPPSQCVRVIRTKKGSELNLYSCSVRVDLDHEMTEKLKL